MKAKDHLLQDLLGAALQIQCPVYTGSRDIRVLPGHHHKWMPPLETMFSSSRQRGSWRDIWKGGIQMKETLGLMTNIFEVELCGTAVSGSVGLWWTTGRNREWLCGFRGFYPVKVVPGTLQNYPLCLPWASAWSRLHPGKGFIPVHNRDTWRAL